MAEAAAENVKMLLMDMDPELLLQCVEKLTAAQQARASKVCKLFAIVVAEIARTTSFMTSGVGSFASVTADLGRRLEAPPTLGICFTVDDQNDTPDRGPLADLAHQLPPRLELIGGQMSVVAGTDVTTGALVQSNAISGGVRHEIALSLGRFPGATVKSFVVNARKGPWRAQLESQGVLEAGWKVMLIIGLLRETPALVDELQRTHPMAAIIGGMATGHQLYRIKHQKLEFLNEGLVGLMFSGDVPLAAFVSRGARALGEGPFTFTPDDLSSVAKPSLQDEDNSNQLLTHVTRSDGTRQTALQATIDCLNADGNRGGGLSVGMTSDPALGFELMTLDNSMVEQSKQALWVEKPREASEWEQGQLKFYSFDPESCKADLTTRLTALKSEASRKGDRLLGAVMFTCGGRTVNFFGEPAFDATTFSKIFDQVPLIGMYAGGEIGPPILAEAPPSRAFQVGGAQMHGFTAIIGMFIVPQRQPRSAELAFLNEEAIAAAYSETRSHLEPLPPLQGASPSSLNSSLPSSLSELRALPIKALKQAMSSLGLSVVPGSEKEDIIQAIAPHLPQEEG